MTKKFSVIVCSLVIIVLLGLTGCFNITVQPPTTPSDPVAPGLPSSSPVTEPSSPPIPPPPPPKINIFSATPGNIVAGSSAKLTWDVSDATNVTISPGVGVVALSGSTNVMPVIQTDYVLTAINAAGTAYAGTQVGVFTIIGLPVINSFIATPPSIIVGSSTLSWNVSNATSVSISQGIGAVGSVGSRSVSPVATTNYVLTASNPAGSVFQTIQVTKIILKPLPLPKFDLIPIPKP